MNKDSNKDCPSCLTNSRHTPEDWKLYHPLAGTGKDNRDSKKKQNELDTRGNKG